MKSFRMMRDSNVSYINELSFVDILKLLVGRELCVCCIGTAPVIIRQRLAYDMFNLGAPVVVKTDG